MRILSATAPPIPVYRCWIPKAFPQAAMQYHDVATLGFTPCSFMSSIREQLNNLIFMKNNIHILDLHVLPGKLVKSCTIG
jgi:hypothetical protein